MTRLSVITRGDTEVIVTRDFNVAPALLWRAHTEPALLQKWLLGPEGWSMPVCICEPVPGGRLHYEWVHPAGNGFHLTGTFLVVEPVSRLVHVERMHLPDPTPDNRVETRFEPQGTGTRMVMTMQLPDAATRAAMLGTGMTSGMETSYARLEALASNW